MKILIILTILFCLSVSSNGQQPFFLSLEQPEVDCISDVVQISNRFYFIQTRTINIVLPYENDSYSDLLITSDDGTILEQYNLNGFRTQYHRILKVIDDDIYLVGYIKSDSCRSRLVISKFNINTHTLDHLSYYDFCEYKMMKIKIVPGLSQKTFIEEYHSLGFGITKILFNMDSTYTLTPLMDSIPFEHSISVDFARTGYVNALCQYYQFYDADFNYRKYIHNNEIAFNWAETHIPFGNHYILQQTTQRRTDHPDPGIQIRLVDSLLNVKKKVVFFPMNHFSSMLLPFFGGIAIKNENEIWTAGHFTQAYTLDSGFYFIAKLDSNLNIICQHFLGYDTWYRTYGINVFDSGGAIVFGSRLREGHVLNEGEDIFAIRVGQNCELPTTSTFGPSDPLISISAYPNPGINDLTFSVNGFDPITLRVELINELGQVLFTTKDLTNSIEVPDLPAGQYFYRILQKDRLLGVGSWVKQ